MKTRLSKALLVPGILLYVLTAAYTPISSAATTTFVADHGAAPADDPSNPDPSTAPDDPFGTFSPNSLPFPICTTCDSGGGTDLR
jgi:hypothetical protein